MRHTPMVAPSIYDKSLHSRPPFFTPSGQAHPCACTWALGLPSEGRSGVLGSCKQCHAKGKEAYDVPTQPKFTHHTHTPHATAVMGNRSSAYPADHLAVRTGLWEGHGEGGVCKARGIEGAPSSRYAFHHPLPNHHPTPSPSLPTPSRQEAARRPRLRLQGRPQEGATAAAAAVGIKAISIEPAAAAAGTAAPKTKPPAHNANASSSSHPTPRSSGVRAACSFAPKPYNKNNGIVAAY